MFNRAQSIPNLSPQLAPSVTPYIVDLTRHLIDLSEKYGSISESPSIAASHPYPINIKHITALLYALLFFNLFKPTTPPATASTPRQFISVVHNGHANGRESRAKPLLLASSRVEHAARDETVDLNELQVTTSPSRVVHDLPSWTPLKVPENDGAPKPDDDNLLIWKEKESAIERHEEQPTGNAQATGRDSRAAVTQAAGRTLKSLSDTSPSKRSKVRFDGVLISTKPPSYRKHVSPPKFQAAPTVPSSTKPRAAGGLLSLVDALARTFNANKYNEEAPVFPPASRPLHADTRRWPRDDASTAGQTPDAETGTEAESEQLQLNTRLARPGPSLKKRHASTRSSRANESGSNSNSEDVARSESRVGRLQGVSRLGFNDELGERPVKRLKVVQYETNSAWVNAALGTVEAPISWDAAEHPLDYIPAAEVKDEVVSPEPTPRKVHAPSLDAPMAVVDESGWLPISSSTGEISVSASTPAPAVDVTTTSPYSNATHYMEFPVPKRVAVLSPYKSRGAKFRQRLADTFGAGAAVRTDRSARPRSMLVDHDNHYPMLKSDIVDDRAPSLAPSESTTSSSVVSVPGSTTTPEEGGDKSALPSTRITSLSPGDVPLDAGSVTTTPGDERVNSWIVALQRLVKGKVRVKEEDLETLSIILAEVESVKGSPNASVSMTSELRQSIQQLSLLREIPFGDRNRLRRRAENMLRAWPLIGERGRS